MKTLKELTKEMEDIKENNQVKFLELKKYKVQNGQFIEQNYRSHMSRLRNVIIILKKYKLSKMKQKEKK